MDCETLRRNVLIILSSWFNVVTLLLAINIKKNKEAWYCNTNPLNSHSISPLSASDIAQINKLEQVHVMTRHGSRTHEYNIQKYFPNSKQYYQCNISSITSRIQFHSTPSNEPYYFAPMLRTYQSDDNWLQHSNCQRMQSYPHLIEQHRQNAQILINAYMQSNAPFHLFDIDKLNQNNHQSLQFMKFYTSDRERCMMSTMILVSALLNISSSQTSTSTQTLPTIETITNDRETNPYAHNLMCEEQESYKKWHNKYMNDIYDNFIKPKHKNMILSDAHLFNLYESEGGQLINESVREYEHPGFDSLFFYCNGFDLPLRNETFWQLVDSHIRYLKNIHPSKQSEDLTEREYAEKKQCHDHFRSIPMYKRYFDDIMAMKEGKNEKKKFILHSAHDSSIELFLEGLGMNYGAQTPYFAQLVTLEIYSKKGKNEKYLFRFTNKGKFLPYEYCQHFYEANESELCDLDILFEHGFADVNISQREWAKNSCALVLDDCVCGYCQDEEDEGVKDTKWTFEGISFVIGVLSGFTIFGILIVVMNYFHSRSPSQKYQMLNLDTPAITEDVSDDLDDSIHTMTK